MEVTRRAFMSLPFPDSPDYVIPDDSITALIHSFFLQRQRPKISGDHVPDDADNCSDKLGRIAKWLEEECPGLFFFTTDDDVEEEDAEDGAQDGSEEKADEDESDQEDNLGGAPAVALGHILERLTKEGYVKGLREDLCGEYTTRLTCKTCGSSSVSHTKDTIAAFGTQFDCNKDFFLYLKVHSSEAHESDLRKHLKNALQVDNDTTRFLKIEHLFTFAEMITSMKIVEYCSSLEHFRHKKLKKRLSCDDKDVRFRTTIDHFPHTLIIDMEHFECLGNISIDEFIDLSELAETAPMTTSAKYKLVVLVEPADDGYHCVANVRAYKYVHGDYNNSSLSSNIDMENMWYKLNDHNSELVPFSEVLKAPEHILLIYEQQ